jgi:hypothetical protein
MSAPQQGTTAEDFTIDMPRICINNWQLLAVVIRTQPPADIGELRDLCLSNVKEDGNLTFPGF